MKVWSRLNASPGTALNCTGRVLPALAEDLEAHYVIPAHGEVCGFVPGQAKLARAQAQIVEVRPTGQSREFRVQLMTRQQKEKSGFWRTSDLKRRNPNKIIKILWVFIVVSMCRFFAPLGETTVPALWVLCRGRTSGIVLCRSPNPSPGGRTAIEKQK